MRITALALSLGLACAGPSFAAEQRGEPTYALSPDLTTVQHNCIVRLHDDIPSLEVEVRAHSLLKRANALNAAAGRANASLKYLYRHSIKGFTLDLPCDRARAAFGDDADVMTFEPDGIMAATKAKPGIVPEPVETTPWSVVRVGGPGDGTGRTAWIIDTGIDLANADLHIETANAFSAFTDRRNAGYDDKNGHGTHVAGIVAAIDNDIDVVGVAAGATVVPVKVLDARGSGTISGVIAGVDHVAANAAPGDCANMSLGGAISPSLDNAVANASINGVYFTIAAGNDGADANNYSPARVNGPFIYTISATDSTDTMPYWSNYGNPPVDYAAPGVNILSLRAGGGTVTMSGTSMAAPAACGVLLMTDGYPNSDGTALADPDGDSDPIIHF
ncbi:MAG: S8 family peptidase [Desulfobulbus sp.]|nr:MAG: S8 family peptidase [Desulfobulbus sp.]